MMTTRTVHPENDAQARIKRMLAQDRGLLPEDGGPEFNRLIFTTSPYLLQHADNPVDWYPWSDEAFARAGAESRPVFLSIGYATCHWCHVMAEESFEDPEVAAVLNRYFVCIKVDREERPDIDELYMGVTHLMGGSGGWPLTVLLTPDRRPFYATTYIPRSSRMGLPGIIPFLERIHEVWEGNRERLERDAATIVAALSREPAATRGDDPDAGLAEAALEQLAAIYDGEYGGFGSAPKFPMPVYLSFLNQLGVRTGSPKPGEMVATTLRMLRQGGICDQLGLGFHRYATDRQWLVPHFEKMLYDQALLATAALEAFQTTADPFCLQIAEEIFQFILREMTSPEGGFYSAQDADTLGEEGEYYLWTPAQVHALLDQDDADRFCRLYGITAQGNFEGRSILHLQIPPALFAAQEGLSPEVFAADLERWRLRLLAAREERPRPFRDEKIITGWNGLMIAALAKGYGITGNRAYLEAATRAEDFVLTRLRSPEGRLLRSCLKRGGGGVPAFLEDYAYLVQGLIALHQVTLADGRLESALELTDTMLRLFAAPNGGLFTVGSDGEQLPVRQQSRHDGALPSAAGVAAGNLFRLARIADRESYAERGEHLVRCCLADGARHPLAVLTLLGALSCRGEDAVTVTLSGPSETLGPMLHALAGLSDPGLVVKLAPEGRRRADHGPEAMVCAYGCCHPPVSTVAELLALAVSGGGNRAG